MTYSLIHAGRSDTGRVRTDNQDRWFADDEQGLYIVADGVCGGHAGGLAAQVVVDTLPVMIAQQLCDIDELFSDYARQLLSDCLTRLSDRLRDESSGKPGLDGMAATVVLALLRGQQALIAHMGDSRAYLLRGSALEQLTADHSFTQMLIEAGEITSDQEETHPARGQLTRCVGMEEAASADVRPVVLELRERLLLCSDGLTKALTEAGIARCIHHRRDLETACDELLKRVNLVGAEDNVTVILIERSA